MKPIQGDEVKEPSNPTITEMPEAEPVAGLRLIAEERQRQIEVEGYTPEHDDDHDMGELALAAALYAIPYEAEVCGKRLIEQGDFIGLHIALETGCGFYVKPDPDNLRRLVKAGALIVAEIDRIQRGALALATKT